MNTLNGLGTDTKEASTPAANKQIESKMEIQEATKPPDAREHVCIQRFFMKTYNEKLKLEGGSVSITIIDDLEGQNNPMLDINLSELFVDVTNWSSVVTHHQLHLY
jgi:hypothetical protein